MDPLWIVLIGIILVVGGILALRLPAFLALTVAAFVVALLTPTSRIGRASLESNSLPVKSQSGGEWVLGAGNNRGLTAGSTLLFIPEANDASEASRLELEVVSVEPKECVARFKTGLPADGVHGFIVTPAHALAAAKAANVNIGERLAEAFGKTCGSIGILIAMASIIGKCLLVSGSADRIVRSCLAWMGEARAGLAFVLSSFALAIPVFFDTVFYLMIPLGKAMRLRTGKNYVLYVLAITAGGTMAHSLVPPTPGPLFVAAELGVDVGLMIVGGCIVGFFTSGVGYLYALWVNCMVEIPLRESADFSIAELEESARRGEDQLPNLFLALLPILLPVFLIAGNTILETMLANPDLGFSPSPSFVHWAGVLGNKNIALTLSAGIAIVVMVRQTRQSRNELASAMQNALTGAGMIILITAAGGAFGGMLQQTGVGNRIKELADAYQISQLWVIAVAWGVTALVRTAQGSATVAMITAVGIVGSLADPARLGYHPLYIALAVGCGSKPLAWMNDSGFWVICKMSGLTEGETLKVLTPMTALMGFVGLVVTVIGAWILPLA